MLAPLNQCSLVKNTRSSGLQVLEGRCLQRPGAGKRLPSREIEDEDEFEHEDDYREPLENANQTITRQ